MTDFPEIEVKLFEMMGKRNIRTIKELKEKTGLSRKAISIALNNANQRMSLDTVVKLCKALDCEIGELITLKK